MINYVTKSLTKRGNRKRLKNTKFIRKSYFKKYFDKKRGKYIRGK